jgi:hypothetical protein
MVAVVVLKGGPGSGFHGHKGRPGEVGGSLPEGSSASGNYLLSQYDIITGNPTKPAVDTDLSILDDSIALVNKVVPSLDTSKIQFTMAPVIMGDVVGAYTKYYNGPLEGQQVLAIAPSRVTKAVNVNGSTLKTWNDIQEDVTYESYMRHTIIHELGHKYWESNNLESSWKFGHNFKGVSGYGAYCKDVKESFADAFAGFVLGYNMDPKVEEWFMENVR